LSGMTSGIVGTLLSAPFSSFSLKGTLSGALDFSTGVWSLNLSCNLCHTDNPSLVICDVNMDGRVDRNDISAILAGRGSLATLADIRDADGDGVITANDARICTLACSKPLCVP
jgi:hypothetical protein